MRYSSLGYRLLGCELEGAAQTAYRKLMRDLVFDPAGMTTITEDDALAIVPHTGGQSGASALLFWFPDSNVAVALLTNRDGSAIRESLARQIGQIAAR